MYRILTIACLAFVLAGGAGAEIINVPGDQPTLAAAVAASTTNDEIVLAVGTYPLASTLYVSHPLTIRGAGMGASIIQCPFGGGSGYGLSVSAPTFAFADFTLEGAGATGPRYGFHVSGAAYADAPSGTIDGVEVTAFYRTGFDFNGVDGVAIGDCTSHHNSGAGLALCDGKNVTFTNITTHDNAWGGVAVYTYGQYHTPGVWGISFAGANSMPDAFYIEEGNAADPANPIPISFGTGGGDDVTLQLSDFAYFMTGESDNDNEYHYFFADLATAIAVAALDPSPFHMASGAHVVGLADDTVYFGIQGAIDAADPYDTIHVAPGNYVEALLITKPLQLYGATAGVNKNGYPVPADYAWDPGVETIITHPNPTSAYNAIVDIYDTGDVTFDGFVVGELDAVANLNTSLVRVYALTHAIEHVDVVNCVIGPNTNLAAQDGAQGRMGLYIVNHPYGVNGVMNSTFAHNKIFDCKGNGNNVFLWSSYYAYGAAGPADMAGTVVDDNEISGSHRSGFETGGGFANLTLSNNTIFGNSQLPGDSPGSLKYGNGIMLIRGSSDKVSDPLTAYGPVDFLISGNEVYGNSKNGVYMGPKHDGVTFTGNVIRDNGWNGVMLDLAGNYWNPQYETPPASEQYACYDCATDVSGSGNEIYGNGVAAYPAADYGVLVNGAPTNGFVFEAVDNWWGAASGPYHDPLNTGGTGDPVSDYVLFEPWTGQAELAALPAASGPINCGEVVELTVRYTPDTLTPALRGFTVTVSAGAELSFGAVDLEDGDPFAGLGLKYFNTIDNGDGTWTIDSAILGATAGLTAEADLFRVTLHPAADGPGAVELINVQLRDLVNGDVAAAVDGAVITVDCTAPPAVTGIACAPAHESVHVDWEMADETDVDHYLVYRGLWYDTTTGVSAYPEYDDLDNDVIPTRPVDRQDAVDSAEWAYAGSVPAGTTGFVDEYVPRGVYWYEVFAVDVAVNYGPVAAANDRATNYWLGDVNPADGDVDNGDISRLGATYGFAEGHDDYLADVDVGPTDTRLGTGIPLTDSTIGFEDLMIFALNFGNVAPRVPAVGAAAPVLAWNRLTTDTWALELVEPCSDLKGLRLTARLPGDGGIMVGRGALLDAQACPVFLQNAGDQLDLGLALMGRNAVIIGQGELLRVTFTGDADAVRPVITARGADNADLEVSLTSGVVELPSVFAVRQNFPNPFNPQTTIRFDLPEARDVRVCVYALDGSLVRTLVDDRFVQGRHEVVWNGRDDGGQQVASGAYFFRVAAGEDLVVRKMLLMK